MINLNKCCNKKNTLFCMKVDKNTREIRVVQILYHFVPIFFPKNLKLLHQKLDFGRGHQYIDQKL